MPRRIPDYPDAYAGWNYVASIGSLISLMSVAILIWVFFTMCYHNPNKPNLKNNVWQIENYYSLNSNFFANFNLSNKLELKSKTNSSSLELSIMTPADYHLFTQGPIMGVIPGPLLVAATKTAAGAGASNAVVRASFPVAGPAVNNALNHIHPRMAPQNAALVNSDLNRGTLLTPNFNMRKSLTQILEHTTDRTDAALLEVADTLDAHYRDTTQTNWGFFIVPVINIGLAVVFIVTQLFGVDNVSNAVNQMSVAPLLNPSPSPSPSPAPNADVPDGFKRSWCGILVPDTDEDLTSSTADANPAPEEPTPSSPTTSELGTQTDSETNTLNEAEAFRDEQPISKGGHGTDGFGSSGNGPDSQQGGGGSSNAKSMTDFDILNTHQDINFNLGPVNFFESIGDLPVPTPISFVVWLLITICNFSCKLFWFLLANTSTPWMEHEYFNSKFINSIIGVIKECFNSLYEQGYMLLWSAFPDKIPPLPGKTPLSFPMLLARLMLYCLYYKLAVNCRKFIYRILKFICYLILPTCPHFTIKYLFYFDKRAQKIWVPLLHKLDSRVMDTNYYNNIVLYYAIRRNEMSGLFMLIIDCILNIVIIYYLGSYIQSHSHGIIS